MSPNRTAVATAVVALASALVLAACEDDAATDDSAEAPTGPAPTITLEAQTPEPLPEGFDPAECEILVTPLANFPALAARVSPEAFLAAVTDAALTGSMAGINEIGVEVNTQGAVWRDDLDEAHDLVGDHQASIDLEILRDYYDEYQSPIARMMASASSWEQLSDDATAFTQANAQWHTDATAAAADYELYLEPTCGMAIDVYTEPGIAPLPDEG